MVALLKSMPSASDAPLTERRIFPRKQTRTLVKGIRLDHSISAHRQPHLALALRDLSLGGLSALSATPLEDGERVSILFPAQGNCGGWDAVGRVIRCQLGGVGYRVAMEFDPLPAA